MWRLRVPAVRTVVLDAVRQAGVKGEKLVARAAAQKAAADAAAAAKAAEEAAQLARAQLRSLDSQPADDDLGVTTKEELEALAAGQ